MPRRTKGNGFTHRLNAQYKPNDDMMFYGTWSRGFRPGGINRQPNAPAYDPDYLTNFELGWKTAFGPLRWNGAVFHQLWKSFQFSFLGENSLTVIQNGRDATVDGIETDVSYVAGGLTLNAAAAYTNAKTKQNVCFVSFDEAADCDTLYENDPLDPDDDLQDFIVTPAGARPAGDAEVQGDWQPRATPGRWAPGGCTCRERCRTGPRPGSIRGATSATRRR